MLVILKRPHRFGHRIICIKLPICFGGGSKHTKLPRPDQPINLLEYVNSWFHLISTTNGGKKRLDSSCSAILKFWWFSVSSCRSILTGHGHNNTWIQHKFTYGWPDLVVSASISHVQPLWGILSGNFFLVWLPTTRGGRTNLWSWRNASSQSTTMIGTMCGAIWSIVYLAYSVKLLQSTPCACTHTHTDILIPGRFLWFAPTDPPETKIRKKMRALGLQVAKLQLHFQNFT